jgi:hypothetical protein
MYPILDGYGVMTAFSFPYTAACEPHLSSERPRYLDTWRVTKACGERRGGLVSQLSSSLCCGRRWHFRKSALSTDKFKLKVIPRLKCKPKTCIYAHVLSPECRIKPSYEDSWWTLKKNVTADKFFKQSDNVQILGDSYLTDQNLILLPISLRSVSCSCGLLHDHH